MERASFITEAQKTRLIQFMTDNEQLRSGLLTVHFTRQKAQSLWEQITKELNCIPGGSKKTWMKWRKTWHDLKKGATAKQRLLKKLMMETGGSGGSSNNGLKLWEKQILSLLPSDQGKATQAESTVEFDVVDFNVNNVKEEVIDNETVAEVTEATSNVTKSKDHTYAGNRSNLKRKFRTSGIQQSAFVIDLSQKQYNKETQVYREKKLKILSGILTELKEINKNLKK